MKFSKLESQFTLIAFVGCVFLDSSVLSSDSNIIASFVSDHFVDLKKLVECCFSKQSLETD